MKIFFVNLTLILVLKATNVKTYDAEKEIKERTQRLKKVCDKYRANPDYASLYETISDPSKNYVQNWAVKLFMCVPAENGAIIWNRFFRQIHNYDLKKYGTYNHTEHYALTSNQLEDFFIESHKSVLVRHPLERTLSLYLSLFRMSDAHVHLGLSGYIKKFWLEVRRDPIKPEPHETQLDFKSRPTLTFRQFVHFLLDCPNEVRGCKDWFHAGQRWQQQWQYCHPCLESMEPDSVLYLDTINQDQDFLFKKLDFDYKLIWNKGGSSSKKMDREFADSQEVQKKYFSTLSKKEIEQLYNFTILDHELFGFTPEKYMALGQ